MRMPSVSQLTVAARLASLEDENRRLRRLVVAIALLSLASAIFLAGTFVRPGLAQEGRRDLETIQAYEFVLRDSAGRVRAHLFFSDTDGSPMLSFSDAAGRPRLIISADKESTSISTYSPDGGRFQTMSSAGLEGAMVEASRVDRGEFKGTASLSAFKQATGAEMTVEDAEGFRTVVGNAGIPGSTGQKTERTTAASVTMYRKGGHIIWQAPPEGERR